MDQFAEPNQPLPVPRACRDTDDDIAIIGAACRLPGADSLDAFRTLLMDGRDAVTEIPDARWSKALFLHPTPGQRGKAYTFAAGVLDDVYGFDPEFFGIAPREAAQIDPQQRLLLELAHEAMEDAGVSGASLAGRPVGVYVGGSSWDYLNLHIGDPSVIDAYSMTGATLCSLSNRVSYVYDLRGPSLTVDTACSSSLVALHLACEAIREGAVPAAFVGGVNLLLAPHSYIGFCRAGMLSPRGRCHAFDARADGYVRSEGGGVVLLKPLRAALADGDRVRAVIRGTGTNSDGRTNGISLPSRDAQAALLRHVYARFNIAPDELDYLEAHGTGTPVGDPIEAAAIGEVLGRRRSRPLPIGSVKTNVGHLEAGSGMAGLLKAMLVLQEGVIPPSLHGETPNPAIPFADLNLSLVPRAERLHANGHLAAVGVNSFGFGGTNAHAVLGMAPLPIRRAHARQVDATLPPLLLSARTPGALRALAQAWRGALEAMSDVQAAAALRALARRREHHPIRLAAAAATPAALADALGDFCADVRTPALAHGTALAAGEGPAFVFSGNGSQWVGMGVDAARHSAAFRAGLERVDAALRPWLGWSVRERLTHGTDAADLRDTAISQPLLFATQVAAVLALRARGIHPVACMGHSVGEIAAAWASGALTLAQASRVIHARSRAQNATRHDGAMAVLGLSPADARAAIARLGLDIAAENASTNVTVAGPASSIDALGVEARRRRWTFARLDLDYAFHSAAMDPIRAPLLADLSDLTGHRGEVPFISTVTGGACEGAALTGGYWWDNVRRPVRFADAAQALVGRGVRLFLEIGPQPVLQSYLLDALRRADEPGDVFALLSPREEGADPFARAALRLHVAGHDISDGPAFDGPFDLDGLPRYPYQRERYELERTTDATDRTRADVTHALLGAPVADGSDAWSSHVDLTTAPWIADHAVGGSAVLPAAAIIGMMIAAARARHPDAPALELADLEISRALAFEPGHARTLRSAMVDGAFTLASRPRLSADAWTTHATGSVRAVAGDMPLRDWTDPLADASSWLLPGDALYAHARTLGFAYGPAFRTVRDVVVHTGGHGFARLISTAIEADPVARAATLLDGALQALLALTMGRPDATAMVPWRFGRVRLLSAAEPACASLRVTQTGPRSVCADILLRDADGTAVIELTDCWFVDLGLRAAADPRHRGLHVVHIAAPDFCEAAVDPSLLKAALNAADTVDGDALAAALTDAYAAAQAETAFRALSPQDIPAAARPLADQALGWLTEDRLAEVEGSGWSFATVQAGSASSPELLQTLLFDVPSAAADAALLAQAGDTFGRRLRGQPVAPPPPALIDQFLYQSPGGRIALAALADAADTIARAWPAGRPLRVLEFASGSGLTSRRLARRLGASCPTLRYVCATTPALHAVVADALAAIAFASTVTWDPRAGAPPAGPFDMIVGLMGLTRERFTSADFAGLRDALAPGGLLLASEPTQSRAWTLIDVPALDGMPVSTTSPEHWVRMAAQAGLIAEARELPRSAWGAALIGGQRDGSLAVPRPRRSEQLLVMSAAADPFADETALALRADGVAVVRAAIDPADIPEDASAVLLIAPDPDGMTADGRDAGAAADLIERVGAIAAVLSDAGLPLCIGLRASSGADPFASAIIAVRRVLANECPSVAPRLIRLSPDLDLSQAAAHLAREWAADDAEQEVIRSARGRTVARVRAGLPAKAALGPATLAIGRPGLLGSLRWQASAPPLPGTGEVAISVRAAGLNFRDVMWAMGLLPDEAVLHGLAGPTLGLECAGEVTAVGPGVTDVAVGDRVMAFAPACLGTNVVTRRHAVALLPDGMDFAAAATIPVAFFTAVYALGELARLEPGERVLIHGAAGGVGLAAIQYARHRGAIVYGTAGSETKRALLRNLGLDAVLDSRSLDFADDVLRLTDGRGVDVVLNSLSGEAMERSLGLLAPFGRFLELGKRDFYSGTKVGVRPLRHNASYFAIDADQLPLARPALAQRLLGEIGALLADGSLRPLPYRAFAFDEAVDAFRLMQSAGHIGKIVLAPGAIPLTVASPVPTFMADPNGTYLVTGGLSGFGLETARWLVRHGARRLALASRRGVAAPDAAVALAMLADDGVAVSAWACDVANPDEVAHIIRAIRVEAPLVGVVHAAMVLDDAPLRALDATRIAAVLRPKWDGAETLDRLTRDDPISLFLLFSSVTTVLGNPGQAAYVAANAALEAIAERRHAAGLPALAVGWGPIGDVGYLARMPEVSAALERRLGTAHMTAADALDALPAMLACGLPVVHHSDAATLVRRDTLPLFASPLFEAVAGFTTDARVEAGQDLNALVAGRSPEDARRAVADALAAEVATILQLPPDRVDVARPLAEFGMDSLMAVELRTAVQQRFGVELPLFSLADGLTLAALAHRLTAPLLGNAAPDAAAVPAQTTFARHEAEFETSDPDPIVVPETRPVGAAVSP